MSRTLAQQLSDILEGRLPETAKEPKSIFKIFSKNDDRALFEGLVAAVGRRYTGTFPDLVVKAVREVTARPAAIFGASAEEYEKNIAPRFRYLQSVSGMDELVEHMAENGWLKGKYYFGLRALMMGRGMGGGHVGRALEYLPEAYHADAMLTLFVGVLKKNDTKSLLRFFKTAKLDLLNITAADQDYLFGFAEKNMGNKYGGHFAQCLRLVMDWEAEAMEKYEADRLNFHKLDLGSFPAFRQIADLPQAEMYAMYKLMQELAATSHHGYFMRLSNLPSNALRHLEAKLEWNDEQAIDNLRSSVKANNWSMPEGLFEKLKNSHAENTLSQNIFEALWDYTQFFVGRGYKLKKLEPFVRRVAMERDAAKADGKVTWMQKLNSGFNSVNIPHNHNPYHGHHPDQIRPYFTLLRQVADADIIKFYRVEKKYRVRFVVKGQTYDLATGDGFRVGLENDLNTILFENQIPYQFVVIQASSFGVKNPHAPQVVTLFNEENHRRFSDKILSQNLAGFARSASPVPPFTAHISEIKTASARPDLDEFNLETDPKFQSLREYISQLESKEIWAKIMAHAATTSLDKKPSAAWLKKAKKLVDEMPTEHFTGGMVLLLDGMMKGDEWFQDDEKLVIMRGLATLCRKESGESIIFILQKLANRAYRKVPGGPLNAKLGNIALDSLAAIGSIKAFGALGNMLAKTKYSVHQRAIRSAMKKFKKLMAEYTPDQLADLSVPDHGIVGNEKRISLGEYEAILTLEGLKVKTAWVNEKGKMTKSAPAELRRESAADVKAVRAAAKSIEETLLAQAKRIEASWFKSRKWNTTDWKKYIGEHALMRFLAEKLIWQAVDGERVTSFYWKKNEAQTVDNQHFGLGEKMEVRLWHPSLASVGEVMAWRNFIFDQKVVQPFKQAFREVYLLTPAEEATHDHSLRFSGHVLHGNKLYSLGKTRGWKMTYEEPPELHLPNGLVAILNIQGGVLYSNCTTMDLHFKKKKEGEKWVARLPKMPLSEIPSEVLSEVMRDVDLFVAVASLAVDPFFDQSNSGDLLDYWRNRSFGEKSKTSVSELRSDLLKRILPMTKMAKQCHLDGNYLHVEGKIRGYKINLGSGNILMKPNDQYLCIVPARDKKLEKKIWLPFEGGDPTLTLILSKAFLLAEDDKITDTSITRQIKSR